MAIASLAESVVDGSARVEAFAKGAKKMLGKRAAQAGSRQALSEAWSIMMPAYDAALKGAGLSDGGLASINARINAAEGLTLEPRRPDDVGR